jgi:hypothetical protein
MSSEFEKGDSHTLVELRKHVKGNSKASILSCLTRLKGDTQCCKRLIKAGGLELLVQLLRYQDLKIMNASLSILANLCMNSDTRQQVSPIFNKPYLLLIGPRVRICTRPSVRTTPRPCVRAHSRAYTRPHTRTRAYLYLIMSRHLAYKHYSTKRSPLLSSYIA